jgi:hypothetical protein
MKRYFEVNQKGWDGDVADQKWLRGDGRKFLCPKCRFRLPGTGAIEVVLGRAPPNIPVCCFALPLIGVIRRDFLEALGPTAQQELEVCPLVGPDGSAMADFFTFSGKWKLLVRGGPESINNPRCGKCGQAMYTPIKSRYLTSASVKTQRDIYEFFACRLVISEEVRERIGPVWNKDIVIHKLPVIDEPRDGLPADFPIWELPKG